MKNEGGAGIVVVGSDIKNYYLSRAGALIVGAGGLDQLSNPGTSEAVDFLIRLGSGDISR